ncbi:hypothetical protein BWP39_14475 [Paraburkholderia acidicola]|uniref:TonB C-terminal domain-containing protein n=1 Tax=Paraburkholderia acidicola TaxID=1912599 RepID=A0A2A4F072_9BURK|nr:energy transducer TonB [Paraburkholderia acidicola]PCE25729.1 hypothetical protein BWP39_14475 [Paraburkholderia acidicola]
MRYVLAVMDQSCARFSGAFVVAAIVWTLLLTRIGGWLGDDAKPVTPPPALQMQLVELPPPPSPPTPSPAPSPVESPSHTTAARPSQPAVRERAAPHRAQTEAPAEPAPSPAPAPAAAATEAPTAHAPSTATATDTPKPTGFAEARLLSQPLPELPDDLREVAYQTVAIARFAVHVDGTCDVELIKPTQNPRLNQILLEALHNWRFFPALDNGRPVESHRDVRVHFNVQ